jgi:hypothetical protein
MCRVEILQEPGVQMDELLFLEEPLVPWDHRAQEASIENEDGSMTTVMYISREGHEMPSYQ